MTSRRAGVYAYRGKGGKTGLPDLPRQPFDALQSLLTTSQRCGIVSRMPSVWASTTGAVLPRQRLSTKEVPWWKHCTRGSRIY